MATLGIHIEMNGNNYILEKLIRINYEMAGNEGDSRTRLSSHCVEIRLLTTRKFPDKFKELYENLERLECPRKGIIFGLRNRKAAQIIRGLLDLENYLSYDRDYKDQN